MDLQTSIAQNHIRTSEPPKPRDDAAFFLRRPYALPAPHLRCQSGGCLRPSRVFCGCEFMAWPTNHCKCPGCTVGGLRKCSETLPELGSNCTVSKDNPRWIGWLKGLDALHTGRTCDGRIAYTVYRSNSDRKCLSRTGTNSRSITGVRRRLPVLTPAIDQGVRSKIVQVLLDQVLFRAFKLSKTFSLRPFGRNHPFWEFHVMGSTSKASL